MNGQTRLLFSGAILLAMTLHASRVMRDAAEAAVSKGKQQQLDTASANQGGGISATSQFRQRGSIGDALSSHRIGSSRFRILPGFLGASSSNQLTPASQLDIVVLYAKTEPMGSTIASKHWQKDNDPLFIWEPPPTGSDIAGYSYALDATPDDVIDTAATSWNVATSGLKILSDGMHTFSVKAVNGLGHSGAPISFELWVDTLPPQLLQYAPGPGALLHAASPSLTAGLADAGSGVDAASLELRVNGGAATASFDPATGTMTTAGGPWKEGANSLELRASDLAGNAVTPLVWTVTVDTLPPTGTLTINAGAIMTTSAFVSLSLNASDVTSGVERLLISNEELAGYIEEPYVALRELWKLHPVRGIHTVYVKFADHAGNVSAPVSDTIELALLSPETVLTSGPAGFTPEQTASFTFACPEGDCVFSYAFDNEAWSDWGAAATAAKAALAFGNHYFRVKAAKDVNGVPGIQLDEEDPSPAERTWIVGVEPSVFTIPKGPPVKLWRVE